MPLIRKEHLTRFLQHLVLQELELEEMGVQLMVEEEEDQALADFVTYRAIQNTCYWSERACIPKAGSMHILWQYAQNPAHHDLFVGLVHVTPTAFLQILAGIQGNPVFQSNSPNPQAPVEDQLALAGCPEFGPGIYQYDRSCELIWQKPGLNGDAYYSRHA